METSKAIVVRSTVNDLIDALNDLRDSEMDDVINTTVDENGMCVGDFFEYRDDLVDFLDMLSTACALNTDSDEDEEECEKAEEEGEEECDHEPLTIMPDRHNLTVTVYRNGEKIFMGVATDNEDFDNMMAFVDKNFI